jgi:uracil-DNA glycosylase family 4
VTFGCQNCPFKTKKIGGKGPFDSPFVIVGESPGAQELARGIPFVGPSGRMLDDVLAEVGFGELGIEPYITNALSCYPTDKDIPKMQHATQCCQERLHAELRAHPREVILCLGASASWAVTGNYNTKITRDRGKILPSPFASKGVVLAVHPAYLMRFGGGLPFWKKDLKSAVQLYNDTLVSHWSEPEWRVLQTRAELEWLVKDYVRADRITADYETTGLQALFGEVLGLWLTKGTGNHVDIIPEHLYYENQDLIKELMEHPGPKWTWHNGKFDIQWSWATGKDYGDSSYPPGINGRCDEDTMLMSYAFNEYAGFHDLDQVAQAWIGAPSHKKVMDQYYKMAPHYNLRNAPPEQLHKYGAYDVAKTHKMWAPLNEVICADPHLKRLYYEILIPATPFIARMEQQGILVDVKKVQENIKKEDELLIQIDARLQAYAIEYLGHTINFGSWQQLRPLIWGKMKLGPPGSERAPMGYSSNEDALVDAQRRQNHPIIHDLLEYREVVKRKGTYVQNLIDHYKKEANRKKPKFVKGIICPDGRIHGNIKLHGTTTGRPAMNQPNLLNQPRGPMIRSQYIAAPGKILVEVDLNQAELRCLAILSGDPTLIDIYTRNEISIHDVTTDAFFCTLQEMIDDPVKLNAAADLLQYFGERTPKLVRHEAKMAGKTINFGIVYGREAPSVAQVFNVSHQEAQRWIDTWFETYPVAGDFIKKCRSTVVNNQVMITPFGRKKRVGVATPETLHGLQNEAANFPHQSIAHDITLKAGIECEERIIQLGGRFWLDLYDALYMEIDEDEEKVQEAIALLQKVMTRIPRDVGLTRIPFIGDAKIGHSWGYMKDWKGSIRDTLYMKEAA